MSDQPLIIERLFDAPITNLWDALTKNEQMKKWYFQLAEFNRSSDLNFSLQENPKKMWSSCICAG